MTNSQQHALDDFESGDTAAASQSDSSTEAKSHSQSHSQSKPVAGTRATDTSATGQTTTATPSNSSGPLAALYTALTEWAARTVPRATLNLPTVTPFSTASLTPITTDLPPSIPCLPANVGNWKLVSRGDDHLFYATDGRAYDDRWGDGGALHRIRLYQNTKGVNGDGKYHLCMDTVIGYENSRQVRNADADEPGALTGIRGHNVQENDGDHAVYSGTKQRYETFREGALGLLTRLHVTPVPLINHVPTEPETSWTLSKIGPTSARWEAPAGNALPKKTISLSLSPDRLKLSGRDPSDSLPDHINMPVPKPPALPANIQTNTDQKSELPHLAAGVVLVRDLLSRSPAEIIADVTAESAEPSGPHDGTE